MATALHPGAGLSATAAIQAAIDTGDPAVLIPWSSEGEWLSGPISLVSNQTVTLGAGVVLRALAAEFTGELGDPAGNNKRLITATNKTTIGLIGELDSVIYGPAPGGTDATRTAIRITGTDHVTLTDLTVDGSGGDGLYAYNSDEDVFAVTNCVFKNHYRNGCTIIAGKGVTFTGCRFTGSAGSSPRVGFLIEPNGPTDVLTTVTLDGCLFDANAGNQCSFNLSALNASSSLPTILVKNSVMANGPTNGIRVTLPWDNVPPGEHPGPPAGSTIEFRDCSISDLQKSAIEVAWWRMSPLICTFRRMAIRGVALNGIDSPFEIDFDDTADHATGGIVYDECWLQEVVDRAALAISGVAATSRCASGSIHVAKFGGYGAVVQGLAALPDLAIDSRSTGYDSAYYHWARRQAVRAQRMRRSGSAQPTTRL